MKRLVCGVFPLPVEFSLLPTFDQEVGSDPLSAADGGCACISGQRRESSLPVSLEFVF